MTKSWIIPFIVYSESFKGSRPMKGEAESKEKSIFLLLGTTSKRHLLNSRNKLQVHHEHGSTCRFFFLCSSKTPGWYWEVRSHRSTSQTRFPNRFMVYSLLTLLQCWLLVNVLFWWCFSLTFTVNWREGIAHIFSTPLVTFSEARKC